MSGAQVDGEEREYSEDGCVKEPPLAVAVPESALKISHTSPDIPLEAQAKVEKNQVHTLARDRVQRQITEPTSSVRSVHISSLSYCLTFGVGSLNTDGHTQSQNHTPGPLGSVKYFITKLMVCNTSGLMEHSSFICCLTQKGPRFHEQKYIERRKMISIIMF